MFAKHLRPKGLPPSNTARQQLSIAPISRIGRKGRRSCIHQHKMTDECVSIVSNSVTVRLHHNRTRKGTNMGANAKICRLLCRISCNTAFPKTTRDGKSKLSTVQLISGPKRQGGQMHTTTMPPYTQPLYWCHEYRKTCMT